MGTKRKTASLSHLSRAPTCGMRADPNRGGRYDVGGGGTWHTSSPDDISSSGRCWPARFPTADSEARLRCGRLGYKSPNEKLNIASIGAGGKASSDIDGCAAENIVALCDVDEERAARKFKEYDKAPKYKDFRKMLDEQANNIDAVIVDHSRFHARHRGHVVHGARQACLRAEAADPHDLGSAPDCWRPPRNTKSPPRWATRATPTREPGRLPR